MWPGAGAAWPCTPHVGLSTDPEASTAPFLRPVADAAFPVAPVPPSLAVTVRGLALGVPAKPCRKEKALTALSWLAARERDR